VLSFRTGRRGPLEYLASKRAQGYLSEKLFSARSRGAPFGGV